MESENQNLHMIAALPTHSALKHITHEVIEATCTEIGLSKIINDDWSQLADLIQVSLSPAVDLKYSITPEKKEEARNKILRLHELVGKTFSEVLDQSRIIYEFSEEIPGYNELQSGLTSLIAMHEALKEAAEFIESNAPNAQLCYDQKTRALCAYNLLPIYERAFGQNPTVNNSQHDETHTPWMRFYTRIMELAFDDKGIPNLSELLKKAGRDYRASKFIEQGKEDTAATQELSR